MDDYPLHQIPDTIRHVGTSDRNFYDRYYFNLHGSSDELFMVMGMGQYPNLAVQDAFAVVDDQEKLWGLCDNAARFELGSQVGYGLHEYGFFGPFDRYGLKGFNEGAV
jgi:hypothetical protein